MPTADTKETLHRVESCNLGKWGANGVALKINFPTATAGGKIDLESAVFGLTHELATGLVKALNDVLAEKAPTKN